MPFSLSERWNLIGRLLPVVSQPALIPGGEAEFGTSDIVLSGFFPDRVQGSHLGHRTGTKLGSFPFSIAAGAGYFVAHPEIGPEWKLRSVFTLILPKAK